MNRKAFYFIILIAALLFSSCVLGQAQSPTPAETEVELTLKPSEEPEITITPSPTVVEYLTLDFSVTPEIWSEIYGADLTFTIQAGFTEPETYPYQYQVWREGPLVARAWSTMEYNSYGRSKSLYELMYGEKNALGLQVGELEFLVFNKVIESDFYMDSQYLGEDTKDVKATVAYIKDEGDKYTYYMFSDGGIAVYVIDEKVRVYPGNKIPTTLPEEVKEKFMEGYTRVDSYKGVVEGSGMWGEW